MGWQSYVMFYNTEEQKQQIINVINTHNELNNDEVGEELIMCCWVEIQKMYKRGVGKNMRYAILCGNGGGRHSTFSYFFNNRIKCVAFSEAFATRANMKTAVPIILKNEEETTQELCETCKTDKLKKYKVVVIEKIVCEYEVEAYNEEEAKDIYQEGEREFIKCSEYAEYAELICDSEEE